MPLVSVPPGAKPGDTVQYDIEGSVPVRESTPDPRRRSSKAPPPRDADRPPGQRMNVVVPDGLAAGDTFSIATPGIPTVQAQALPSRPARDRGGSAGSASAPALRLVAAAAPRYLRWRVPETPPPRNGLRGRAGRVTPDGPRRRRGGVA